MKDRVRQVLPAVVVLALFVVALEVLRVELRAVSWHELTRDVVETPPHTDFVFAILGEETGLLGTLFTLALYLFFLWRGVKISLGAPSPTYKMIAAGITLAVVVQALMNISIVLGLGPAKGMPLPLLSYGRSSLVCTLAAIGILLHISQKKGDGGATVRI